MIKRPDDALWATLTVDDCDPDPHGYTPEPDEDDDRPIMLEPLRPMPRPEPTILHPRGAAALPPRPAPPSLRPRSLAGLMA